MAIGEGGGIHSSGNKIDPMATPEGPPNTDNQAGAVVAASIIDGASKAAASITTGLSAALAPNASQEITRKETDPLSPTQKASSHQLNSGGNPQTGESSSTHSKS